MKKYIRKARNLLQLLDFQDDRQKAIHVFLVLAGIFLLLTAFVLVLPNSVIDLEFSEEMQEDTSPLLDMMMKMVSWFGGQAVAVCLVVGASLAFLLYNYKREALFVILTLLAPAVNLGLKLLIDRPRPTENLVDVMVNAQYQSFPSGHVVFYVAFFGFVAYLMYQLRNLNNKFRAAIGFLSISLIAAVPFSRVYLGAHWFTDVLAGFVLGLLLLAVLVYFYFRKRSQPS